MKDGEVKRIATEQANIEAFTKKHRPSKPNLPDEVNKQGTGDSANSNGTEGPNTVQHSYKKATKPNQIKSSNSKGTKSNTIVSDPLLGEPMSKPKKNAKKLSPQNL